MIGGDDVELTTLDDDFHPPGGDDPFWNETSWFSFMVPERKLYGYVYPWVRQNQGINGGGVIVWDAYDENPWDCLHWTFHWNLPTGDLGDLRDKRFESGVRVVCLEALSRYQVTYEHPDCSLDLVFTGLVPPHAISPAGAWNESFFGGHFDQPMHVQGRLVLFGEEIAVDCYSLRDRSWGPRVETDFHSGYYNAQTADSAFLAYTNPELAGAPILNGYLWDDGAAAVMVEGHEEITRDGPWLDRVVLQGTDALGRPLEAVGTVVNRAPYLNMSWMLNWVSLARWEYATGDGATAVGWGEIVESWHIDTYRRFVRGLRGRLPKGY